MFINYLRIKNFKSISELEISNFRNINLIIGAGLGNGQGKSSVVEAITFLLTNNLNSKIEDYVKWYTDKFEVQIKFHHFGKDYDYTVIGSDKGTKRKLYVNGEEYLNSDATKKISEIINPTITLYSVISEQDKATQLLYEKPADRLEKLKKIFNIEKLSTVVERIKEDISNNKESIIKLEAEINVLESRVFEFEIGPSLPEINVDQLKQDLQELEDNKKVYENEVIEYSTYLEKLKQYENASNQIQQFQSDKIQLDNKCKEMVLLPVPINHEKYITSLEKALPHIEKVITQIENDIKLYNVNKASYDKLIDRLQEKQLQLKEVGSLKRIKKPDADEKEFLVMKEELLRLYDDYKYMDNKYFKIKNGKCPECDTIWQGDDLEKVKNDFISCKENYESFKTKIENIEIELNEYKEKTNENNIIKTQQDAINNEIKNIEFEINSFQNIENPDLENLENLNNKKYDIESSIIDYKEQQKEYDTVVSKNEKIMKEKEKILQDIRILESKIEEYSKIIKPEEFQFSVQYDEDIYISLKNKLDQYIDMEKELIRVKKYNTKIKQDKKDNNKNIEDKDLQVQNLKSENKNLDILKKVVDKDFSSWLISKGIDFIKKEMNRFFMQTYNKYQIDIQHDKKSVSFYYGENENNMVSVNTASGIEKALLATSFRIALCKLQQLNFFIMDEVDAASSEENSMKLFNILLNYDTNNQYFIITHKVPSKELLVNEYNAKVIELDNGKLLN